MSDFQTEMNRVVGEFVAQITELAKRAAIDTLEGALGKRSAAGFSGFSVGRGGGRRKGAKRTSADLESMGDNFHTYVLKNPGLRIEQINKQLGTTTKDLALPIRKMIAEGSLKTKGEKRSTTYFASEKKKSKKD